MILAASCAGEPSAEQLAATAKKVDQQAGIPEAKLGTLRSTFTGLTDGKGSLSSNANYRLAQYNTDAVVQVAGMDFVMTLYFNAKDQLRYIRLTNGNLKSRSDCSAVSDAFIRKFGRPMKKSLLGFWTHRWSGNKAEIKLKYHPAFDAPSSGCDLTWEHL